MCSVGLACEKYLSVKFEYASFLLACVASGSVDVGSISGGSICCGYVSISQ